MPTSVESRDEPPKERNGSGMPLVGRSPIAIAILKKACRTIVNVMPQASKVPKRFGARRAMRHAAHEDRREQGQHASAPSRPSSSQITGKMKSV